MPQWTYTIRLKDVFRNESMTFEQRRDTIVARLRSSAWLKSHNDIGGLVDLVDDLADATNTDEFDSTWDAIYDYADLDRAWIETF